MAKQPKRGLSETQSAPYVAEAQQPRVADETVGLIVVHGIGEQKKGDHLEAVVRPLSNALQRSGRIVTIEERTADAPATDPGVRMLVHEEGNEGSKDKLYEIGVHEVHWADINEPQSIGKGIRFWLWGLSAWTIPIKAKSTAPTFKATLAVPRFEVEQTSGWRFKKIRLPLFFVGWLFALAAPILLAIEFLGERIFGKKLPAGLKTVVSYVSAVKLYSQPRRHGHGLLDSAVEPPRYAIRRRMVRAMADIATHISDPLSPPGPKARYDRWYVIAHSQGTVVAQNGLMASSPALAAYLDDERLARLQDCGMAGPWRDARDGPPPQELRKDRAFRPAIPAGRIGEDRTVYRDKLFANFRGFLSYGSPLDKFAAIWPPTVAINRDTHAFPAAAQWINVWDPTDPVANDLDAFDPNRVFADCSVDDGPLPPTSGCAPLIPKNIAYAAFPVLLASHVCYLTSSGKNGRSLVGWLADWILGTTDDADQIAALDEKARTKRRKLADIQIGILAFVLFAATTYLVKTFLIDPLFGPAEYFASLIPSVIASMVLMLIIALIGRQTTKYDVWDSRTQSYDQRTRGAKELTKTIANNLGPSTTAAVSVVKTKCEEGYKSVKGLLGNNPPAGGN